jgi:cytochrome b pre-mRNA-processing protein 3
MLRRIFGGRSKEREGQDLYAALVQQARLPEFYKDLGIPDTPEGRYEVIVLHAFLLFQRLNTDLERTRALSQRIFDVMFSDLDDALREMGVGDVGVSRRMKSMLESFYGRVGAYESGLASQDDSLQAALDRNIFAEVVAGPEALVGLAAYVRRQHQHLSTQSLDQLTSGTIEFDPRRPKMGPD